MDVGGRRVGVRRRGNGGTGRKRGNTKAVRRKPTASEKVVSKLKKTRIKAAREGGYNYKIPWGKSMHLTSLDIPSNFTRWTSNYKNNKFFVGIKDETGKDRWGVKLVTTMPKKSIIVKKHQSSKVRLRQRNVAGTYIKTLYKNHPYAWVLSRLMLGMMSTSAFHMLNSIRFR